MTMRSLKSLWLMVAVSGLMAAKAFAGPIPIPLLDPMVAGPQLGESTLLNAAGTTFMEIDWMVVYYFGPGLYGYFYQVENRVTNPAGNDISSFTLFIQGPVIPGSVVISSPTTTDWDPVAAGTWPPTGIEPLHNIDVNGDGVIDEFTEVPIGNSPTSGGLGIGTVTWTWPAGAQLQPGTETTILAYLSPMPPVYGEGNLFDGPSGAGWGLGFNIRSQPLPVPSPEPATAALLLMGVLGLGVFHWRRRS